MLDLKNIFPGKRYFRLSSVNDQVRYMIMTLIFSIAVVPLSVFGFQALSHDSVRASVNFSIAAAALFTLVALRTNIPLKFIPVPTVLMYGAYCVFLLYNGSLHLWVSIWIFSFPLVSIFLCKMFTGVVLSSLVISAASFLLYKPGSSASGIEAAVKFRYIAGYVFIFALAAVFEYVSILKDKKEKQLNAELLHEKENLKSEIEKATDDISRHLGNATENGKRLNNVILESSMALDVISDNMEITLSETDTQLKSVSLASAHVSNIVSSVNVLEISVSSQASHIQSSSASIEQMVANINSVRSVVNSISKTADSLVQSSASGNDMMKKLSEEIGLLRQRSQMLQNANKIIQDISAKTNLLSMNAAIEAAHAGDSGRGFAVVADEVRKLADSSAKESKIIKNEINKMNDSIKSIAFVTEKTVQSMNLIFNGISDMDKAFAQVNNAVEEQAQGGFQILESLKTIKDETVKVKDETIDLHGQSGSIAKEMEILQKGSQNVKNRVNDTNEASKKISLFLENAKQIVSA